MEYRNKKGQVVGKLHKDGVFRKIVSQEKHLFRSDDAWGMDTKVLKSLPDKTEIRILDKDENVIYITSKEIFLTGLDRDFGHGEQKVLWRGFFDTIKDGVRTNSERVAGWVADWHFFENYQKV